MLVTCLDDTIGPRRGNPVTALLVFDYDRIAFAVEAARVESVIPWRDPVPLPRATTEMAGVIQDRGRIVTVLQHPAGVAGAARGELPRRILVCPTGRGHVGLPATSTRLVGEVELRGALASGAIVDSSVGALTFVDPEALVARLIAPGPDEPPR
jgi:hypothetical protein